MPATRRAGKPSIPRGAPDPTLGRRGHKAGWIRQTGVGYHCSRDRTVGAAATSWRLRASSSFKLSKAHTSSVSSATGYTPPQRWTKDPCVYEWSSRWPVRSGVRSCRSRSPSPVVRASGRAAPKGCGLFGSVPLENACSTRHRAMPTVPLSVTNRFLSGVLVPLRTLRAMRVHEALCKSHVTRVIAIPSQAQVFCTRNELEDPCGCSGRRRAPLRHWTLHPSSRSDDTSPPMNRASTASASPNHGPWG